MTTTIDKKTGTVKKREKFHIDRKFTDAELLQKGKSIPTLLYQKKELEDRKKQITSQLTSEVKGKEAEINIVSNYIQNGYENIQVEGDVEYDYEKSEKRYLYQGKVYDTKRMTAEDFQTEMVLQEEATAGDKGKAQELPL